MTTKQTLQELRKAGKPICLAHLYRLFPVLGIRPLGRSRPQIYPPDTAERIKAHLGISSAAYHDAPPREGKREIELASSRAGKLISVRTLRAARPKKQTKGTK